VVTSTRWFRTAAAIFFVALWGSAFVPSKIGVLASSPLWFLVARFAVSGGLVLAIALASGASFPRDRRGWLAVVLLGVLTNALYLGCGRLEHESALACAPRTVFSARTAHITQSAWPRARLRRRACDNARPHGHRYG
jgi:hypothetical protein